MAAAAGVRLPPMVRSTGVLVLVLTTATSAGAQPAQDCPLPDEATEALAERTIEERAAFVAERFRRGEHAARTWTATFALGYLGIAVSQVAALVILNDDEERDTLWVGAVSSMIGVASFFALPLRAITDREEMEALAPEALAGDCAALRRMEALLERAAASEEFGTSWLVHLGNVLFNLGVGLYLGLVHGEWVSGAIAAGVGVAVGELQILTQPTHLVSALAQYRDGQLTREEPLASRPLGAPSAFGLGVEFAF